MYWRNFNLMITALMILGSLSCTKEEFNATGIRTVDVKLVKAGETDTRSTIDVSSTGKWPVGWTTNDIVYYYTGKGTTLRGGRKKHIVTTDGPSVTFAAEYSDGDNSAVFFTLGNKLGAGTVSSDFSTLEVTNAVPINQDGKFASTHIGVGFNNGGLLDASPIISMYPAQGFIRFKMSSTTFGDKTVNKIIFTGSTNMTGNLTVNTSNGTKSSIYATGKIITIDKTNGEAFFDGQDYYLAVLPGTYTQIQADLYNGSTKLATLYIKKSSGKVDLTVASGKILDIGDLNVVGRKHVPATSITMYPTWAAFHKDMADGKKIWLRVEPSDFDGTVEWKAYKKGSTTVASTTVTVSAGAKETLPDVGECFVGIVKPTASADYTWQESDIIATVKNTEGTTAKTAKCEIKLGEWIYMGSTRTYNGGTVKILWAMGRLTGTTGTTKINHSPWTKGDIYMWGCKTNNISTSASGDVSKYTMWGGNWWGNEPGQSGSVLKQTSKYYAGGKYNDYYNSSRNDLEEADDVCCDASGIGKNCHTPSKEDWMSLISKTNSHLEGVASTGLKLTSLIPGYTDMEVDIACFGRGNGNGSIYLWSRSANGTDYTAGNTNNGARAWWMRSSGKTKELLEDVAMESWLRHDTAGILPVRYEQ